jgi:hypothetical protein
MNRSAHAHPRPLHFMNLFRFLRGKWKQLQAARARAAALAGVNESTLASALNDWSRSLRDPTGFYLDCHRYFHLCLDPKLRSHRAYFNEKRRGFGEDAFHVQWWLLFQKFRPRNFLEIGVYRGQTLSLAALLQQECDCPGLIAGISPFLPAGDSVSKYRDDIDYEADTRKNFAHFRCPEPTLVRAYSTDLKALAFLRSEVWDCIYIDGNHDYPVAQADWDHCAAQVRPGGLIVLDDAALQTAFAPPPFATAGHPGPSQLAREIDPAQFVEILRVGHNRTFQKVG